MKVLEKFLYILLKKSYHLIDFQRQCHICDSQLADSSQINYYTLGQTAVFLIEVSIYPV